MYDESSFYSIDRLVEFGMGMAIARQMVQTMNQTMETMRIPGAGNAMDTRPPPAPVFFVILDGRQAGPFSGAELTRLISEKKVSRETYIWMPGMKDWQIAENVPSVLRLAALRPPEFKSTT
ncbi:MAG: DUF4339 domain-containing protein [Treponema sp.]|jgi:hypothetical protein|nr:DUF4339 domain-containing protein [Treponema sp.]